MQGNRTLSQDLARKFRLGASAAYFLTNTVSVATIVSLSEGKPFVALWRDNFFWTATVESITEKLSRCRRTLEKIQPGCISPRSRKRKK